MLVIVVLYFSWLFLFVGVIFLLLRVFMFNYFSLVCEFLLPRIILYDCSLVFCFDYVSILFFSCVSLIRSVVFFFRKYYMDIGERENSDQMRFLLLLFLFVLSIFFLVFSHSWFFIILGWDGLGVISFLLVIYYNDRKSLDSGLVTVFTNRIGDCLFLLRFSFIFWRGRFRFSYLRNTISLVLLRVVFAGCITKRAQIPFSSWLPAAIAAPTPVSSLVHSSTLVTAGVYLLIRFNYLLEDAYFLLGIISLITMALAGLFAVYELDFKKVVAISTLRQLGFIVFRISSGMWILGFLHIMFHAFFKRSLFLSTGRLIHLIFGNQDSRLFGGFFSSFFVKLFFSLRCIRLIGFPFSLGFYSKDIILGGIIFEWGSLIAILFRVSCCFTVAYRLRLLNLGFIGFLRTDSYLRFAEDKKFFFPVLILFFLSLFLGNYFIFYFLPVNRIFSFFELIIGLFVITGGFLFFKNRELSYRKFFTFASMINLPSLVSYISLNFLKICSFKDDLTWGELFTRKGVEKVVGETREALRRIFSLKYLYLGVLGIILFLSLV